MGTLSAMLSGSGRSLIPLVSSGAFLVLANVVPLVGAIFWGWSIFEIVVLYWAENLVIGFCNGLKMLTLRPDGAPRGFLLAKLGMVAFFSVHYGIFCLVHGVFVFTLLGRDRGGAVTPGDAAELVRSGVFLGLLALVASHGFSYLRNYLMNGEFRRTTLDRLMMAPYPRIVVLHLAILFGAFAIQALGSPATLLALLVVGKTVIDLALHGRSHRDLAAIEPR